MAAPRVSWKGFLTIAEVTLPVALYAAASLSERIALHTVNRTTGNPVQRQYVELETGEPVEPDVGDLMTALRQSANMSPKQRAAKPRGGKPPAARPSARRKASRHSA